MWLWTGVYWKPVYNILEDHVEMLLVNARHVKNVPGRKTDVNDAEWLADLRGSAGSFVPRLQRDLRNLTRQRSHCCQPWKSIGCRRCWKTPTSS